jgi:hypothetical protein
MMGGGISLRLLYRAALAREHPPRLGNITPAGRRTLPLWDRAQRLVLSTTDFDKSSAHDPRSLHHNPHY